MNVCDFFSSSFSLCALHWTFCFYFTSVEVRSFRNVTGEVAAVRAHFSAAHSNRLLGFFRIVRSRVNRPLRKTIAPFSIGVILWAKLSQLGGLMGHKTAFNHWEVMLFQGGLNNLLNAIAAWRNSSHWRNRSQPYLCFWFEFWRFSHIRSSQFTHTHTRVRTHAHSHVRFVFIVFVNWVLSKGSRILWIKHTEKKRLPWIDLRFQCVRPSFVLCISAVRYSVKRVIVLYVSVY